MKVDNSKLKARQLVGSKLYFMGQLSQVATVTRQIVKYGGLGLVAYIILSLTVKLAVNVWRQLHPPAPPPPTVAFGKLQPIAFPNSVSDKKFSYKLETPSGTLPAMPDRATIYALPPKQASLLALDKAKSIAKKFGFLAEPQALTPKTYRFSKMLPALLNLDYNLIYDTFTIDYQWQNDETILRQKQFQTEAVLKKQAGQILKESGLLATDLETGEIVTSYLKASANKMIPAVSLSEADFVKIDFFRALPDEAVAAMPQPADGAVSFTFSGNQAKDKEIVHLEYSYFPVDFNSSATYPLRPVNLAWEELLAGKAYIAGVKEPAPETITIRRIYLALYDSDQYQPHMQPVYVFQGDNNFYAYIMALDPKWLK